MEGQEELGPILKAIESVLNSVLKTKAGTVLNWAVIIAADYELFELADYVTQLLTGKSIVEWSIIGAERLVSELEVGLKSVAQPIDLHLLMQYNTNAVFKHKVDTHIANKLRAKKAAGVPVSPQAEEMIYLDEIDSHETMKEWSERLAARTGLSPQEVLRRKLASIKG